MVYAMKRPKGLDLALSIVAAGHGAEPSSVVDAVIQSRGVILDELAARARSTAGSDPELASLNATLFAARQRFANLMLRSVQDGDSVRRELLDAARRQKEDAERATGRAERGRPRRADTRARRARRYPPRVAGALGVGVVRSIREDRGDGGQGSDVAVRDGSRVSRVRDSVRLFDGGSDSVRFGGVSRDHSEGMARRSGGSVDRRGPRTHGGGERLPHGRRSSQATALGSAAESPRRRLACVCRAGRCVESGQLRGLADGQQPLRGGGVTRHSLPRRRTRSDHNRHHVDLPWPSRCRRGGLRRRETAIAARKSSGAGTRSRRGRFSRNDASRVWRLEVDTL